MMRDRDGGFLSGYVGVPDDHPLYGFAHDTMPAELEIEVQNLAFQLRAIADGKLTPQRRGPPLPSLGLDPNRGR